MDVVIFIVVGLVVLLAAGLLVGVSMRGRPAPPAGPPTIRRGGLGTRVRSILRGTPGDEEWAALEESLVGADTGTAAAREIVGRVRDRWEPGADAEQLLIEELVKMFDGDPPLDLPPDLAVVMVVGVNGTGKTTTIGKLAKRLSGEGRSVAVAASDTFRAGASEQLATWAERGGAHLVSQTRGADPGAVAHDAVEAARARGHDVLIVDTAGRIHTKKPLMEELRKVKRVLTKAAEKDPDEVLLVVDATTGQNGIAQARTFLEAVEVTGIALTKLDGAARGGVVLAIRKELGVPVKLVGTGESIEDLRPFDPKTFARSLMRG
ncbi:MAG TPA: signal recognition particle-docking protein FtsY [Actinomycetota bacterium]|nr:signal recognition particle-docking protein FtsY [Actinomycetota bacterium]